MFYHIGNVSIPHERLDALEVKGIIQYLAGLNRPEANGISWQAELEGKGFKPLDGKKTDLTHAERLVAKQVACVLFFADSEDLQAAETRYRYLMLYGDSVKQAIGLIEEGNFDKACEKGVVLMECQADDMFGMKRAHRIFGFADQALHVVALPPPEEGATVQ